MQRNSAIMFLCALFLSPLGVGSAQAVELKTSVKAGQVANVTRDVAEWHDMKHADCNFLKVVRAKIVMRAKDGVTENWTIQACNKKQFTYSVYIMPFGDTIADTVSDVGSKRPAVALVPR